TMDGRLIEILLVLGALAAFRAVRKKRFVEAGLVLFWAHLTLESERHVTLATVVLVPIIAEQWSGALAAGAERRSQRGGLLAKPLAGLRAWYQGMMRVDRRLIGALDVVALGAGLYAV